VLAEDALELGRQRRERRARPLVSRVRLELHSQVALRLERVLHQEQLRLGVRTRPPRRPRQPGVADLEHAVAFAHVQVARVAERPAFDHLREPECRLLHVGEPRGERLARHVAALAHQAPHLLVAADLPQRLLVPLLERLQPHVPSFEDYVKRQVPPSSNERRIRRATTILWTSSAPS
jgi:hypothetical protein